MRVCVNCKNELPEDAMFCDRCGTKLADDENNESNEMKFCEKCGAELVDDVCPRCTQQKTMEDSQKRDKQFSKFFMDSNEKLVTVLGNNYVENYFQGNIKKGFAVVSDKRVYFQGTTFELRNKANGNKKIIKMKQSRTIDLIDVTGTGFDSYSNFGLCILNKLLLLPVGFCGFLIIMFLIMGVGGGVGFLKGMLYPFSVIFIYILTSYLELKARHSFIKVQYSGGEIAFEKTWFEDIEIDTFQKELRIAKDKVMEKREKEIPTPLKETVTSFNQPVHNMMSCADELKKYVDLLEQGYITQEDYEKVKKDLLKL